MSERVELLKKRTTYLETVDSIMGKVKRESRHMTDDERSDVKGILRKVDVIDEKLSVEQDDLQSQLNQRRVAPGEIDKFAIQQQRGAPNVGGYGRTVDDPQLRMGEFLQRVAIAGAPGNRVPDELQQRAVTGMGEGIGSDGGFLVGTTESSDLLQRVYSSGQIASRVRRLPPLNAGTNRITMPYIDETSRATGSRLGGVQMYWQDEAQQMTASKPAIGKLAMSLNKITGLCYATDELLQDARQLAAIIGESFRKEMTFSLEDAIFRGSGAGRPLGFMNSNCKITVSKEGSQPADTIVFDNVAAMMARLNPASIPTAVWLANISCLPQLLKMSVPIQNIAATENVGGSGAGLIYDPSTRKLLGLQVLFNEYSEALGDEGDLALCDLNEYLVIDRAAESASSIHVRFDYGETAFRFVYRVDGLPAQKTALTPYKGTATTSPFITLQAR